ncbi:MAG: polyprenyl synthetase family protein [Desulfarculus sp.]|nr:polyprenyl synthetase family protein [Desulfarculus sp.]
MATPEVPQHPPAPQELLAPLSNQEVKERVLALAQPADQALTANLTSHVPFIEEVSGYIIFSGGKRLRPVLFLLASRALGRMAEPRHAAIFEYLHAATLLHDDVVDDAGLRRGRPAARVKYGNDAVILVGDFLFSKSYSLSVEVPDLRFVRALTDCTTHMAEGQVLELIHTDDLELGHQGYLRVIVAKTAVLLAAACQMGAIQAGASDETVRAFYDYGMELGVAFQMVDDALDYVGSEHEFGKPVGHDLEEGKITLPFIHARDHASPEMRARLLELARRGRQEPQVLTEAKEIIRAQGGVEATVAWANFHAARAQAALKPLLDGGQANPDLLTMLGLASYVITRRA